MSRLCAVGSPRLQPHAPRPKGWLGWPGWQSTPAGVIHRSARRAAFARLIGARWCSRLSFRCVRAERFDGPDDAYDEEVVDMRLWSLVRLAYSRSPHRAGG